jgi:hypothetical protein
MNNEEKKELVVLTPFEQQKSELQEFVKDFRGLVVTADNCKEMNEKRLVLYRKRLEIQRIAKANKDALNKAKKINDERETELVAVIKPVEDEIQKNVQAIENIEKERVDKHKKVIEGLKNRLISVFQKTEIDELNQMEQDLINWEFTYDGEEFKDEINQNVSALKSAISSHKIALEAALAQKKKEEEAEKAELEQIQEVQFEEEELTQESVKTIPDVYQNGHSVYPHTPKDTLPAEQVRNPIPGSTSAHTAPMIQQNQTFSYAGYSFVLDGKLSEDVRTLIAASISKIIDENAEF